MVAVKLSSAASYLPSQLLVMNACARAGGCLCAFLCMRVAHSSV